MFQGHLLKNDNSIYTVYHERLSSSCSEYVLAKVGKGSLCRFELTAATA